MVTILRSEDLSLKWSNSRHSFFGTKLKFTFTQQKTDLLARFTKSILKTQILRSEKTNHREKTYKISTFVTLILHVVFLKV